MTKLSKLAAGVALAVASSSVFAGGFSSITSESVGVEAASAGTLTANIAGDSVVLDPSTNMSQDNRLYITLTNGAKFNDSTYTLEQSTGGAGTGDTSLFVLITPTPKGASTLEFRASSDINAAQDFILGGSSVTGQAVSFQVPALAAGQEIQIDAEAKDTFGVFDFYTAADLFGYANQFSAAVDTRADATIDVNADRMKFTGDATADTIALEFNAAVITNGVSLTDDDKVSITLSGDMSTIQSIVLATDGTSRGNFTIDTANGKATFSASASDAFAAASTVLTANVWGSGALATRTFTVQADVDFETETDKNVIAASTAAGQWDINGLQAKVSHLSLNSTGFVSWLKVVNEGSSAAEVSADIIYTLADGTEGKVSGAALGSVDAGGVATVSEASILAAIGNPTQLVDVSMTVTVAGQVNLVHLVAEKKAANGRVSVPVYYNTTGANARNWVQ